VAQALETIATSADLGAPQTSLEAKGLPDGDGAHGASGDSAERVADGNFSTAIVEESPHLLVLLGAIVLLTLVGIAAFLLRRRITAASVD
jgi:hypothetical protein